ncbi:ABC transporter ATP-binding protein [Paenibacillus sp. SC116]|uniref:ABC transporter ATP-binding protein n=1 Tax=Paenibacillus sp. SC116 TaxID=2968986 RepID=UPI00215AC800|nr:ABC transporter ATP-binding protein [Paenibacillus sp. SC116]MCR8845576.1 ABC transporter ATP-binding protein [Paenibacillus sp. SC116]
MNLPLQHAVADEALLQVNHLQVHFPTAGGTVTAVDDISFQVKAGETVCIVGESGCGKSVTALALMGLLAESEGCQVKGDIVLADQSLNTLTKQQLRRLRGNQMSMIFQEPMSSFNPVLTIGRQLMEPLQEHLRLKKKAARTKAVELIRSVGIARPESMLEAYPHELSGGMLQRMMIAMAIACRPQLLIADEPTTALDVTIQAQILDLLRRIKEEHGTSIIFITHDLGVVAEMADYVIVMYAGKIVEQGSVIELFDNPKHPYTQGLLRSKPVLHKHEETLYSIPGQVPHPLEIGDYCSFYERCDYATSKCRTSRPYLQTIGEGHKLACWLHEKEAAHDDTKHTATAHRR